MPGSENRIVAMIKDQVKGAIVDLYNKNILMEKVGDRFHTLPGLGGAASDEVLFANNNWIKANREGMNILVEELLRTWRDMVVDPTVSVSV